MCCVQNQHINDPFVVDILLSLSSSLSLSSLLFYSSEHTRSITTKHHANSRPGVASNTLGSILYTKSTRGVQSLQRVIDSAISICFIRVNCRQTSMTCITNDRDVTPCEQNSAAKVSALG